MDPIVSFFQTPAPVSALVRAITAGSVPRTPYSPQSYIRALALRGILAREKRPEGVRRRGPQNVWFYSLPTCPQARPSRRALAAELQTRYDALLAKYGDLVTQYTAVSAKCEDDRTARLADKIETLEAQLDYAKRQVHYLEGYVGRLKADNATIRAERAELWALLDTATK